MACIVKAITKDPLKRTKFEPFAALHYDGSYNSAGIALGLIGVDNLAMPRADRNLTTDELIDKLMDDSSHLHLPEIMENEDKKLISSRALVLHVDSWIVLEVDPETEWTEIVFYTDNQFKAKYDTER